MNFLVEMVNIDFDDYNIICLLVNYCKNREF